MNQENSATNLLIEASVAVKVKGFMRVLRTFGHINIQDDEIKLFMRKQAWDSWLLTAPGV